MADRDHRGRVFTRDSASDAKYRTGAGAAAVSVAEKQGTSLGAVAARNRANPMPKLADFGGDEKRWKEAVRAWQNKKDQDPEVVGQKRALERMP